VSAGNEFRRCALASVYRRARGGPENLLLAANGYLIQPTGVSFHRPVWAKSGYIATAVCHEPPSLSLKPEGPLIHTWL
jgi:hypothetical protein